MMNDARLTDSLLWAGLALAIFLGLIWLLRPQPPKERPTWIETHWPF